MKPILHNFSIVSFFDESVTAKIRTLQHELHDNFGVSVALDTWEPHITVASGPTMYSATDVINLIESIKNIGKEIGPIAIELEGFDSIKRTSQNGHVVYVKIKQNEKLVTFAEKLKAVTDKYNCWYDQKWPYHPHITLAFRDVDDEILEKCMKYLETKSLEEKVIIGSVSLVKPDNEGKEEEFTRIQTDKEFYE